MLHVPSQSGNHPCTEWAVMRLAYPPTATLEGDMLIAAGTFSMGDPSKSLKESKGEGERAIRIHPYYGWLSAFWCQQAA